MFTMRICLLLSVILAVANGASTATSSVSASSTTIIKGGSTVSDPVVANSDPSSTTTAAAPVLPTLNKPVTGVANNSLMAYLPKFPEYNVSDSAPAEKHQYCVMSVALCDNACGYETVYNACNNVTMLWGCQCKPGVQMTTELARFPVPYYQCTLEMYSCIAACDQSEELCAAACMQRFDCGINEPIQTFETDSKGVRKDGYGLSKAEKESKKEDISRKSLIANTPAANDAKALAAIGMVSLLPVLLALLF